MEFNEALSDNFFCTFTEANWKIVLTFYEELYKSTVSFERIPTFIQVSLIFV